MTFTDPRSPVPGPQLYQFPATRFISNTIWRQWWHMASELLEVAWALIWRDYQHAATEIWNFKHSGETGHRILAGMGCDIDLARQETLGDNIERGYYDIDDVPACRQCGCAGKGSCGHEPIDSVNLCTLDAVLICPCCRKAEKPK